MSLPRKIITIFDDLLDKTAFISCYILAFFWLAICYEVIMRYFFKNSQVWVVEGSGYMLVVITFLSIAWVLREEGHVKMDILVNLVNLRAKALIDTITSCLCGAISLIITYYSVMVTISYFRTGSRFETVLMPPKALIFIFVPIGSFLLLVQFLRRTYKYLEIQRALQGKKE